MSDETPSYLDDVKRVNMERLISHLNGVGASILQAYPNAEVQSWTIQRSEALAVKEAGPAANLLMAPFIAMVCAAHHGPATDAKRLLQVREKSERVLENAELWAALSAYVNGLRARVQDQIETAQSEAAAHASLHAAFTELGAWRAQYGI